MPLLLGTLAAAVVLGAAAYGWRRCQVARIATALLQRAEALEQEEDWEKAAECLHRCLRLRPNDADILARLAWTYDRSAEVPVRRTRAVELYYRALAALGDNAPIDEKRRLRCRLAELLLELSVRRTGCSAAAERQALLLLEPPNKAEAWQKVRAENPDLPTLPPEGELWWVRHPKTWCDAQGARLWVLAIDRQTEDGTFTGRSSGDPPFDEQFTRALELNPRDVELSILVARIYRDEPQLVGDGKPEPTDERRAELAGIADVIVNDMVAANPESPEALLSRYQYQARHGLRHAAENLDKALQYGPDNAAVLLAAVRHAREEALRMRKQGASADEVDAQYDEALALCRRAVESAPSRDDVYLALGDVCRAQGKNDQAIEAWRRGLEHGGEESLTLHSRLAEILIAHGQLDQARRHLDALDREAAELAPHLTRDSQQWLRALRDLLRGEWLIAQSRYNEAIPLLRRVALRRSNSDLQATRACQAWQLLGAVYAERSQWDLAAEAYEEVAKLQPEDHPPEIKAQTLLAAANAWNRAGRPEIAVPDYERALAIKDDPETWVSLARAAFQRQIGLPSEERSWNAFDEALAEAGLRNESLAEPWRVTLLEVDALVAKAKGKDETQQALREAAKLLRQTEAGHAGANLLFHTLVLVYEGLGLPADADRVMDKVDRLAEDPAAACVLRSRLHSRRKEYGKARQVLAAGAQTLPPTARAQLQIALLQMNLHEGQLEAAYRQLLDLHESSPANLDLVWQLAELALERNDLSEAARWEEVLRDLEGPDGSYWRYVRARRLLAQAASADDSPLTEAGELQRDIQGQRRAWPAGYVLGGLLSERRGRYQEAIAAYEKAIRVGERRISVYERLIALLYRKQRFDEARRYLSQLQDYVPSSRTLSTLDVCVAAQRGDRARALQAARRGVDRHPQDPMARIWLAQMLLGNGQADEAEAALREAVRLAPDDRRTADALFAFYVDTRQHNRAREVLERLAENPGLSDAERALALAIGYDRIGDRDAAETHYRELAQASPEVAVQKRLAAFLFQNDPEGAENALRRALQLAPQDREARRTLAYLLASRGGLKEWQEVQRLMGKSRRGESVSAIDRRLEALLLVQRGGENHLTKARDLLEQLVTDPAEAIPGDRLLLARLHERDGMLYMAGEDYAALVQSAEPDPAHLISYIDFLLRHDRLYDANRWLSRLGDVLPKWLAKLERKAPDRLPATRARVRLDAARLRARWLRAHGRTSEIKSFIDRLAGDLLKEVENAPEAKADVYLRVGDLYSAVEQHREAEAWYRLLANLIPERYEPLAAAKARQGQVDEAIQICVKAAESDDSPRPAIVMARVLGSTRPSQEDLRIAEPLLSGAVEKHPDNTELLTWVAYVRCLQKRIDDAVELYESILARKPGDPSILNNLAVLLSEQPPRRNDALDYVDQAIAIAGPKPWLLDTKGTILILKGKAKEAVELLEEASSLESDPQRLLHLAVAYQRTGELAKARESLRKARDGNLTDEILTETDKRLLTEVEKGLGRKRG